MLCTKSNDRRPAALAALAMSMLLLSAPVSHASTIESYGGGTGLDNTPALNAAIAASDREIVFGRGQYRFDSRPNAIPFGMTIRGAGMSATTITKNYLATSAYQGFLTWTGAAGEFGGGIQDVQIRADVAGGSAVVLTGTDQTHRASVMDFKNLWISGLVKWDLGFVVLGTNITDPTNGGVRDISVTNLYVFECNGNAVEAWAAKNFWITGGQLGNYGNVFITGSASQRSEHVFLNISDAGTVYVSFSSLVVIQGAHGGLWRNGSVDTLHVSGRVGTVSGTPAVNEKIL